MVDFHQVFNDSYARLNGDLSFFFDVFYQKFAARSEDIARAFESVDMARQKAMLESSFIYLTSFSATGKADDDFLKLALMHRSMKRISTPMFDQWLAALLETVAQLDPQFDDDVAMAWRVVMAPGLALMKHYELDAQERNL